MLTPLIITVAGIGAELSRDITPHVPLSPDEISREVAELLSLGAQVFHLHVRDHHGKPTCDPHVIRTVVKKTRKMAPGAILQISTGGSVHDTDESRLGTLLSGIEMASLTLGSINFGDEVFLNPVPLIRKLAAKMRRLRIRPELEIFDVAMLEFSLYLIRKGEIVSPPHYNFVMGGRGFLQATEQNLDYLIGKMPRGATFSVAGIGVAQMRLAEMALARKGHVRVGLEDNIYLEKGVLATNRDLCLRVMQFATKHKRRLAKIQEVRRILKLL